MDWVALLTPLLVLAVVALLGFAGCEFEPGSVPTPTLTLRARVPTALTVTQVVFRWTPPGGTLTQQALTNPAPTSTDGADNLFEHQLSDPPDGAWMTDCRVTAQEGTATAGAGAQGVFTLDGSLSFAVASFQAAGSPSGGNFTMSFVGVS